VITIKSSDGHVLQPNRSATQSTATLSPTPVVTTVSPSIQLGFAICQHNKGLAYHTPH